MAVSRERARRPGAARNRLEPPSPEELDACPFCAGREDRTPPETLRLPQEAESWHVRVVPNLYPALDRHEVVVHGPRHVRSLAELDDATVELVAEAWQRRARDAAGPYVQALVNEGRDAGASLPHSHSQLVWLPEPPPAVTAESALPAGELVLERQGLRVVSPWAARLPYELQISPADPQGGAFSSPLLAPALRLLAEMVRRLHALEGPVPLNAWLHDGPHWHLELVPRLSVLAGLELGAGVYVNSLPSEEAAARLRDARRV